MQARFVEGTFDRIANALESGEDRTEFVRKAVEKELARREGRKRRLAAPHISDTPIAEKRGA